MKIRHHLRKWLHDIHWKRWENHARDEHAEHLDPFGEDTVAVPEVHTGKVKHLQDTEPHPEESIHYDNVAIPEIHIYRKK